MVYRPKYAKGEVLVSFRGNHSDQFAKEFGERLGYEFVDYWGHGDCIYVFKTPLGEERSACKRLESYGEFVEWAEREDVRLSSRWESLEEAVDMLQNVESEVSRKKFKEQINRVVQTLRNTK